MTTQARAIVARTVANLRHFLGHTTLDRELADRLAAEIGHLEAAIVRMDEAHRRARKLVDGAEAARGRVVDRLERAEATLQRIMQILGPDVPAAPECAGCASEIAAALEELHAYGIRYQPRKAASATAADEEGTG